MGAAVPSPARGQPCPTADVLGTHRERWPLNRAVQMTSPHPPKVSGMISWDWVIEMVSLKRVALLGVRCPRRKLRPGSTRQMQFS